MGAGTEGYVIVYRHRKRVRLLENHTDASAQQIHVHIAVNILAVQQHLARNAAALNQIVHTVKGFKQG